MYKKILSFVLAVLCVMSCGIIGVGATDNSNDLIYFKVPDSWGECYRIYCHITILDTGVTFASWQSKKERCTQVEGNLWVYDLAQVDGEIMDECSVVFSSDTGQETHPLMLKYDGLGDTAYCDGTTYEKVSDSNKVCYAAFWENKEAKDSGPIVMITESGEPVGVCKSEYDQTNEIIFENFIQNGLVKAQELTVKTDQELIDDIIEKLGISDFTADKIIRKVGAVSLEWGNGYGIEPEPYNEWEYTEVDGEIILTSFHTKENVIDIPETIDGKPVTGIDSKSFFKVICLEDKTVNIPASVTNITTPVIDDFASTPIKAFNVHEDNPAYSSIDGVLYSKDKKMLVAYPRYKEDKVCTVDEATLIICESAFFGGKIEEIILPNSLEEISANAFFRCVWLKELNIPSSVKYIDSDAFEQNRSLRAVNVSSENENYCSVNGVLYNKDKTEIVYFPIANGITSYDVQDGVVKIGKRAFQAFSSLDEVTLPNTVEVISYRAFYGCGADVNIPENLKVIEEEAFAASGITEAIVPNGVTELPYRAFYNNNLTKVILPEGIKCIGKEAFAWDSGVEAINIPETVETIDEGAFKGCASIDEIAIPDSVKVIGKDAFAYCSEDLIIYGSIGSAAHTYATENGIRFIDENSLNLGDVNGDTKINIKDATVIQKASAKIIELTEAETFRADVNADTKVNVKDATMIQKYVANIIDEFGY